MSTDRIRTARVEDLRRSTCLQAANLGESLQTQISDFKAACSCSALQGKNFPCGEMEGKIGEAVDLALQAWDGCPNKDDPEAVCNYAENQCPMAMAGMMVACIGFSVASLKVQASAIRLRSVA